jgi:elongation factor G
MKNVAISQVRNFALLGHTGSGKTTLADALLFKLGLNDRMGDVEAGSSMADYTDEEKSRKITIFSKPFGGTFKSGGGKEAGVVFIDTPGYMDFFGQTLSALSATDAGLILVDATSGVQVGTQRVWRSSSRNGVNARGFVVTGLDKDNADYRATLSAIQSAFGNTCVPVVIPTPDGTEVVDVFAAKEIPESVAAEVEELKGSLIELAAETDDTLIEKFLDGQDLSPDEIASGLVDAVSTGGFVPVFACVAPKGVGVDELLEGIVRLFPSPGARERKNTEGEVIDVSPDSPLVAQVWRTVNDPFVGQLTFTRVIGGTLSSDSEIHNTNQKQKERIGALLHVNGKKQDTIEKATAGDVVAIPKLKATALGDTLCTAGTNVECEAIRFPKPVMFQSVRAKTQADEDKIGTALNRVCEVDPTLRVERNIETHETVLQGLGDVHIDVAVGLMKTRSNVDVILDTPKVPYRETITSQGEGHYKHKKQSGGRGQYGEVYLKVEPRQPDDEEWFVNRIVGGAIPGNFIPAVQKGLVEGMVQGAMARYPVTDVKVTLYDGTFHDVDSSEIAFKIAGARALREALSNAKPVMLEPIMAIKVSVPDNYLGDINGDLNHRRGRILGMGTEDGMQVISAEAPQSELFRYAADLRSMTGGQGTFEMEYARYEQVPAAIAQKVVADTGKGEEED